MAVIGRFIFDKSERVLCYWDDEKFIFRQKIVLPFRPTHCSVLELNFLYVATYIADGCG